MNLIFKPITICLLRLAKFTANTSAAKYYIGLAVDYEEGV